MENCPKCHSKMIVASLYDPDGEVSVYGGVTRDGCQYICLNSKCEDGKKNTQEVMPPNNYWSSK